MYSSLLLLLLLLLLQIVFEVLSFSLNLWKGRHSTAHKEKMRDVEWGKMVMPGVYMIQRGTLIGDKLHGTQENYLSQPDLIHHDIKELDILISKLKNSNKEIENYLVDPNRQKKKTQEIITVDGEICDEDEIFRQALLENKRIIQEKEREVERLRSLINLQGCGKTLHEEKFENASSVQRGSTDPKEIESPIFIDL